MATQFTLDPVTERAIDEVMSLGSFGSRDELLREAVRLICVREGFDPGLDSGEVDDATREAVERGVADVRAGRVRPVADVFRDLRRRYELG